MAGAHGSCLTDCISDNLLFDKLESVLYYADAVLNRQQHSTIRRIMPKMMTNIPVILLVGLLAVGLGNCNDSPVRPKETNTCWKPLDSTITGFSHSEGPAWSPSGKFVAFVGFFDSCNNPHQAIYITESGGKSRRALNIIGSVVHWLPPGDSVIIVNEGLFGGGELVKYNIETDVRTPLGINTTSTFFDVSSDGRFIYYDDVWISERDLINSTFRRLIEFGASPAVSPSGALLSYGVGTLNIFDLGDSTVRVLRDEVLTTDWLNDTLIAGYSNETRRIGLIDLNGNETDITTGFGPISVSPDGNRILFRTFSVDSNIHIWIVDVDGGGRREFIR
jgi:WD40-like Beta Propeller Repeat